MSILWKCLSLSFVLMFLDLRTGMYVFIRPPPKVKPEVFFMPPLDAILEGSSTGPLEGPFGGEAVSSRRVVRVSDVTVSRGGRVAVTRRKRNVLFPSGVKLCARENAEQVVANHLSFFNLRVCQETVWEAFKIFWDRLPEQEEYQSWMNQCQGGAVTARDIGAYFSQSGEHQEVVKKKMSAPALKSEPTRSGQHTCSTSAPAATTAPAGAPAKEVEEAAAMEPEMELDNDIPVEPLPAAMSEQAVELSILLTGVAYDDDLDDSDSLRYQTLSRHLAQKITDALSGLPGFKSVTVMDFRLDGIAVDYAVTLAVDDAGISGDQLDYLTLQSNRVENSYGEVKEHPTLVYAISELKTFVTENLLKDALESVPETPETPETVHPAGETSNEPAAVPVLDDVMDDVKRDQLLPGSVGGDTLETSESDIVVLEESVEISSPAVVATSATETGSIKEEGLLLENTVQTTAADKPPDKDQQEPPASEEQDGITSPEPPALVEASGTGELENLLWPEATPAAEDTEDVVILEEEHLDDGFDTEDLLTSATAEDDFVPDVASEATEEGDSKHHGEPAVAEADMQEPTESEGQTPEEAADSVEEAPTPLEEPPEASEIVTDDLVDDDILLVNKDALEPSVSVPLSPAQPTAMSAEKESPFTRVADVKRAVKGQPEIVVPSLVEIQNSDENDSPMEDLAYDVFNYGLINHTEEGSTGFPFSVSRGTDPAGIAVPANPGRALMVFFSLRVTNMIFSEDLFNKSSPEYKALEQRFLQLLVPYLQSNLSNFENLEILNFRNGSIVVNSRMKFGKPVAQGVTTTVYLILEDFCNTAYQTMNLAIDKYSLDVESGDQADPCKFQACNEYAECKVNKWSGEAECVCNAGYFSVDGLPCQSICELRNDFCLNDGKCDIIPGQGAICSVTCRALRKPVANQKSSAYRGMCRVGENWWYRGEHCEEYVSEPLVVGIAVASVAGFLMVASGVIFFLARTLRDQYDKDESEDPIRRAESVPSLERATKYNPMYESEATTGYSHYYRRYPEAPAVYSSASAEASTDFSSEEIRHIYENSELTKEEIQDRIRIIELYAKDRQFADFVRQHQAVLDTRRESSSAQT
ncbi:interphotoreceptor matrix proteoglycan 2 isoform X2 [Phycodurus eques]|uniref:interphotoreceptor matrix proteoglycan 2 isoform X2 n=1 Tax=Phycodurus eques TaxID=693459 RepID=UPI002ACE7B0C|nr:interphotoreceptor matrix proteoglycan 2 isoform X2 [Phycodurus eques]